MSNVLGVAMRLLLPVWLFSCQKEAAVSKSQLPAAASASGFLWQGETKEVHLSKNSTAVKENKDGGVTVRSRSFEKAFTFSRPDCTGEELTVVGSINYTTTDVYDKYGNEIRLKAHLVIHGKGKTADGEMFQVHEMSQENYDMRGAKAGGNFLLKERWHTAHHSGTIIFKLAGKFDAETFTYHYRIASIEYQCG